MATSGVESRQGVVLTLPLLQDMEISVFELRTILNRVIARRKRCPSCSLLPVAQACSAGRVLMHMLNLLLPSQTKI